MAGSSREKGFAGGALGGLAIGLLLVGAGALFPQISGSHQGAASQVGAPATNNPMTTTSTSSQVPQGLCCGTIPYTLPNKTASETGTPAEHSSLAAAASGPSTMTTATTTTATSTAPGTFASSGSSSNSVPASAPARPDSLLTAMPGEGTATLLGTLSPLLLGLLVAGLVYSAYSRKQDA